MQKRVLFNRNLRKCENCGEIIPLNSEYCSNCGDKQKTVKLKDEKKENTNRKDEQVEKVCPQCGTLNDADAKFCGKCGYQF
ncbi:50S ribosomal protein L40e [compost metagenome]